MMSHLDICNEFTHQLTPVKLHGKTISQLMTNDHYLTLKRSLKVYGANDIRYRIGSHILARTAGHENLISFDGILKSAVPSGCYRVHLGREKNGINRETLYIQLLRKIGPGNRGY